MIKLISLLIKLKVLKSFRIQIHFLIYKRSQLISVQLLFLYTELLICFLFWLWQLVQSKLDDTHYQALISELTAQICLWFCSGCRGPFEYAKYSIYLQIQCLKSYLTFSEQVEYRFHLRIFGAQLLVGQGFIVYHIADLSLVVKVERKWSVQSRYPNKFKTKSDEKRKTYLL